MAKPMGSGEDSKALYCKPFLVGNDDVGPTTRPRLLASFITGKNNLEIGATVDLASLVPWLHPCKKI